MLKAFIVGAILATAGSAAAGWKWGNPVTVNLSADGSGVAFAHVGTTYNSADNVEFIWCRSSSMGYVSCLAKTAAGVYGSCYESAPSTATRYTIASLNGDSYMQFGFASTGGCNGIDIYNGSQWHPKKPPP